MKALRVVLYAAAGLAVLAVVLVALLFVPAIQKALVLRTANAQPDLALSLASVGLGPSGGSLRGVDLTWRGARFRADEVEVRVNAVGLAFGAAPNIALVRVAGGTLDLTDFQPLPDDPATAADKPDAPFPGVLPSLTLGELRVGNIDLALRVTAPAAGLVEPADIRLRGGALAPDAEGVLQLDVAAVLAGAGGAEPLRATTTSEIRIARDASGAATLVAIETGVDAAGGALAAPFQALLTLGASPGDGFETWRVRVGPADGTTSWVDADLRFVASNQGIRGAVTLDTPAELAALAPVALPAVSSQGTLEVEARLDGSVAGANGELRLRAVELGRAVPALAALRSLDSTVRLDVRAANGALSLRALDATVALDGAEPALRIALARTIDVPATGLTGLEALGEGPLLRATLQRFPLELAALFVPGLVVESGTVEGDVAVASSASGLSVRSEQPLRLAAATLALPGQPVLRGIDAGIRGEASLAASGEVRGNVEFDARLRAEELGTAHPGLAAIGAVGLTARGALDAQPSQVTLQRLEATVADAGGANIAALTLNAPLTVDPARPLPPVFERQTVVATLALFEVPLAWSEAFQPDSPRVRGGVASGTIALALGPDGVALRLPERGLSVGPATLALDGTDAVENVTLRLNGEARLRGPDVELRGLRAEVRTERGELATLRLEGAVQPATGGGEVRVNLAGQLAEVFRQPLAGGNRQGPTGRFAVESEVTFGAALAAQGTLRLEDVAARAPEASPPRSLGLAFRASQAGTRWSLGGPLTWNAEGRESGLDVSAGVDLGAERRIDLTLKGQSANLDDLLALVASLQPPAPAAAAPAAPAEPRAPGRPPAPTSTAPWGNLSGGFKIDVARAVLGGTAFEDVGFTAALTPEAARFERAGARFAGGTAQLEGGLAFETGRADPVVLGGTLRLENVDTGELFAALQPGRPLLVDTVVDADGSVGGRAPSLESLPDRVQFQLEVRGGEGTSAALQYGLAEVSGGDRRGVGGLLRGLAGAAGQVGASLVTPYLAPLRFERLTARVVRGPDLDVVVDNLELRGPEVRLSGALRARHVPGAGILDSTLQGSVQLAAKGRFAADLQRNRFIQGAANELGEFVPVLDELGYAQFIEPVLFDGTLGAPGNNLLRLLTTQAAGRLLERL